MCFFSRYPKKFTLSFLTKNPWSFRSRDFALVVYVEMCQPFMTLLPAVSLGST